MLWWAVTHTADRWKWNATMGREDFALFSRRALRLHRSVMSMSTLACALVTTAAAGVLLSNTQSTTPSGEPVSDASAVSDDVLAREAPHEQFVRLDRVDVPAVDSVATVDSGDDEDIRWFDGRPIRPAGTMTMVVTAYSPDERSCGKWADGITASGYSVWTNGMKLVAADTSILPLGTLVSIPGYDGEDVVPVLDRGGAIKGKRLDVLYPSHERALQWGVQTLEVTIWEYADGKPDHFRTSHR